VLKVTFQGRTLFAMTSVQEKNTFLHVKEDDPDDEGLGQRPRAVTDSILNLGADEEEDEADDGQPLDETDGPDYAMLDPNLSFTSQRTYFSSFDSFDNPYPHQLPPWMQGMQPNMPGLPLMPPPPQQNSDSPRFLPMPSMPGATDKDPADMMAAHAAGAPSAEQSMAKLAQLEQERNKLDQEMMKLRLEVQQAHLKGAQPSVDAWGMPPGAPMMPGMGGYGGPQMPYGMPPPGYGWGPGPAEYGAAEYWGMGAGGPMAAGGPQRNAKKGNKSNSAASNDSGNGASNKSAAKKAAGCKVPENECTTTMLRNLPNNLTKVQLLELLDSYDDLKGKYDFVYLPMDFQRTAGLGYAFVNWVDNASAKAAWAHFQGFTGWAMKSEKICEVAWGDPLQGRDAHIDRYRNSPVMHEDVQDEYKPVLFENGKQVPFPGPTKKIRPPRLKSSSKSAGAPANSAFPD